MNVFGPLKTYYGHAVDCWHRNNTGKTLSIYCVAATFGQSYDRAFSAENIKVGFAAAGIELYQPNIFKDSDFLCSVVSDRPKNR